MSKANDKLTEGLIYSDMANGATVISRIRVSELHRNQKIAEGRDIRKGSGSNTTNVMIQIANNEPSWDFNHDGRDALGRYINPRLVMID
jgi:hypothetical protein